MRTPIIIDVTEQTIDTFEYCEAALVSPALEACILCSDITRSITSTTTIITNILDFNSPAIMLLVKWNLNYLNLVCLLLLKLQESCLSLLYSL